MADLTREELYIEPVTGNADELARGHEAAYGFVVLNRDRTRRDLTSDTLTVNAKTQTGGSAKTLGFTADANQTTTGKGKCTLTIEAADTDSGDDDDVLLIDLLVNDRVVLSRKITIRPSSAE